MTFLHKLAQRLARMKTALIVAVVAAIACEVPLAEPSTSVGQLQLAPKTSSLRTGQTVQFIAFALTPAGDTAIMSVRWSATGGSIVDTSTTGGRHYLHYKSPDQPGQYKVITQSVIAGLSDSAVVNVSAVPVASVSVTPGSASLVAGQTVQLTANTLDSTGAALSGRVVTWVSNNTGIATVSASGLVSGVAAGSATLTATSEGKSGTAAVTVTPVPVASVGVSPGPVGATIGQTVQLTATPRDAGGNALVGRVVTWGTSNSGIATVSGGGLVTGVAAGSATITATSEGKGGTATITVTLTPAPVASVSVTPVSASVTAGQTVQLTATPRDAGGNVLVGRVVTWGSSNTGLATVNGSGLVTGVAAGAATITATSEGQSGSLAVSVTAPVASVSVTPPSASVTTGQTVQLTATPRDAGGNALTGRVVTWGSSGNGIATVNGNGLVTGVAAGSATITATSEGKSGTATITVTPAPVASVSVSPASASVTTGQTVQLTATPRDASGNALVGRVVTWGSSNTGLATVTGSGLATGVAVGSATITATSEGKSGSAVVTVTTASSVWTHEPAGLSGLATLAGARDYDFTVPDVNGTYPTTSGWYNEYPGAFTAGELALVTDNTAPSPNNVVQVKYPLGWNIGGAPGQWELNHTGVTEYFLGFYFKISSPYQGVSGGHNKIAYIYSGNKDLVFEFTPSTGSGDGNASSGPWHFFWAEYVSHNGAEFDTQGSTSLASGVWYKVEILMSYSQGVMKWWVNGVLDGTIPCNFNANAGGPLHLTYFSPTYGGGGLPAKTEVDYVWYDHVHLSGAP